MLKYLTGVASICLTPTLLCSQNPVATADTLFNEFDLQEIIIKADSKTSKADRNIFYPTHAEMEASVNGRDLIGRLHIPRIILNPLTGEIGMTGNGEVALTINGVISSSAEVAGISPEDIIRVEHIDNPGPRYPDAQIVLNIITRRHSSGGTVAADLLNAFKNGGEADLDNLSLGYSHGKSQWNYNGEFIHLRRDNWTRDYSENRIFADKSVTINEKGEPSKMEFANLSNYLSYSISSNRRYLFNAKLGLVYNTTPHSEEADRTTIRTTSESSEPTLIYEHMGDRSLSPSLDLYGEYTLPGGANLLVNLVGTYIHSKNDHIYRETTSAGEAVNEISSDIRGDKYSLISEASYSQSWGNQRVSFGIRHFQAYARNRYSDEAQTIVRMHQSESSLYGQYTLNLDRVNLMGSFGLSRYYNSQDSYRSSRLIVTPAIAIAWTPTSDLSLRYRVSLKGKMPSLSEMNNVVQEIDPGYYKRGNPDLKAYRILEQELNASWEWNWLSTNLSLPFSHEYKPVMTDIRRENNIFYQVAMNQKSFTHFGGEFSLGIRPWKDHIMITLTPSFDRYISKGIDFSCAHTLKNLRIDAEFNYKHWQLSYNTMTGYANYMYGTRLMKERNMSMIMAGYKTDRFSIKLGVIDPFIKRYWMETREMAKLLNSVSKAYSDSPTYLTVQVSVNLTYGRGGLAREREIENQDIETGILKGVK